MRDRFSSLTTGCGILCFPTCKRGWICGVSSSTRAAARRPSNRTNLKLFVHRCATDSIRKGSFSKLRVAYKE